MTVETLSLKETLQFIRDYIEHGDIKKYAKKHSIEYTQACRIVKGESGPKFDFLADLKTVAQKNHSKVAIKK